jgi:hypothetical protein
LIASIETLIRAPECIDDALWPASPKSTLFDYFDFWNYGGTLENIHHA